VKVKIVKKTVAKRYLMQDDIARGGFEKLLEQGLRRSSGLIYFKAELP
jgi:hypothetical protein